MGTAIVAIVVLALLLGGGGGKGTGGKELPPGDPKDPPPKPDPDKPKPTTDPKTPKPKKVPAKGFGDPKTLPDWFDPEGNSFWISPDCSYVAEGKNFLPFTPNVLAEQQPTLAETLAVKRNGKQNTAWGFIDYLVDVDGYTAAPAITARILQEANTLCADLLYEQWPAGLKAWAEDFQNRIVSHVEALVYGGDD